MALENPMATLPPTAQRLLAAARRVLEEGGFDALRLQAIAREAGEPKASIAYHFGNKAGLVASLVDFLMHDANLALIHETERMPVGDERIHALVDGERRIAADRENYWQFFEVLPHALRDDDLRPRVAGLYDGYRETVLRCLGARGDEERRALLPAAMLMIAIVDGLAIQQGLDADIDVEPAIQLWERLVRPYLREAGALESGEGSA
jgi:TetR/AcrR family transcriptional repressor of bet genes